MKTAAFGFRMHSGWGALVAVSGDADSAEVVHRCRLEVIDPSLPGGKQPYHYAAELPLEKGKQHISNCSAQSKAKALTAICDTLQELKSRQYQIKSAAVLMASGRALPSLPEILASHPIIHTAEREFFRSAVIKACAELKIPLKQFRERELEDHANSAFGKKSLLVLRRVSGMGIVLGPPWTADYKAAALAALLALENQ